VVLVARRRRRNDAGGPDRTRGRHGEPAPPEGGEQEQQAQGAAALALPPEPLGKRKVAAVATPVPRDGEESRRPCPRTLNFVYQVYSASSSLQFFANGSCKCNGADMKFSSRFVHFSDSGLLFL
jgi:hypothetical protein